MAQEKQHYLQRVEHFCTQVKNDWYRVYLVRKLTSQCGMEKWEPGDQLTKRAGSGCPSILVTSAHITTSAWEKGGRQLSFNECLLYIHYLTSYS